MNYHVGKVVGINTDQQAAIAASINSEENLFLGVLQLECDDAFTKGRQIIADSADSYFEATATPAQRLTEVAEEVKKALAEVENPGETASFLLAGFSGKALYLIGQGQVRVKLGRAGNVTDLDISSGQVVSGFLEPGDRVMLSTNSLVEFLGGELNSLLQLPLEEWEDTVTEKVRGAEPLPQAGLALDIEPLEIAAGEPTNNFIPAVEDQPAGKKFNFNFSAGPIFVISKLRRIFPHSGRGKLLLALVLILVLAIGVGFQFKTKRDSERNGQYTTLFESARSDYEAAQGLSNLDPKASKDKLTSAKDSLTKALALKPSEKEALDLKKQIEDSESGILQQFEVSKLPEFLDLSLIKDGFQAKNISLSEGTILLLDTNTDTLVSVDLAKKSHTILAGKDALGSAAISSINSDNSFTYSSDKGIVRVNLSDKKVLTVAKKDSEWGSIADLAGFGGNVYALDSSKNQIWKYLATSTGYSDRREYLTSDVKADFAGAIRMQIESSIYVLKSGGEILRFTRGAADNFAFSGFDTNIKDPKSIFTSSDTDNLYILDSGNSRLVVTTKTGAYKAQYSAGQLASATDLVIDEKGKKAYILDGSKIYSLDLK